MPFDFSDLNAQIALGAQAQYCVTYTTQTICACLSRPYISCRCVSNQITVYCRLPHSLCYCYSKPAITIPCICLSKPIITGRPPTIRDFTIYEQITEVVREVGHPTDLDLLRAELDDAIKHIDVQQEVLARTAGQPDEAFDAAEAQLKEQLELIQKQRAEYRKKGKK